MKGKLLLVLLAMLLFVWGAMAAETGQTTVTANFVQPTIAITAPEPYTWTLSKVGDNQVNIGNVNVVSTDSWNLNVLGTNNGHLISTATNTDRSHSVFILPVRAVLSGSVWGDLTGSNQLLSTGVAGTVDVPVSLKQTVSPADQAPATIMLTFTGSLV
jgi:hypothetical protein